ncbi:hypothetical protein BJQ89_02119 [Arthrobacter sp. ES1]|nr:hypothetical protein [Arthrobacter sp. ES1]
MIGKISEPSVSAAVPTVPGVSFRVSRALAKEASSFTAVEVPVRAGMEASALGASADIEAEEDAGAAEVLLAGLQAARENISEPAAAIPAKVLIDVRMGMLLESSSVDVSVPAATP